MLRKSFKEPSAGPLPHLRNQWLFQFTNVHSAANVLFTGLKHSPLAALCRSCIATRRVADCHTASHTWCTCSAQWEKHGNSWPLDFFLLLFNFSRQVHPAHLFAVLAHNGFNPGRPQLLPTQQTARHPVTAYGLFYVIQAVYQATAAAQETPL